eukprot:1047300-Pyramimonas_sp.AAC.1
MGWWGYAKREELLSSFAASLLGKLYESCRRTLRDTSCIPRRNSSSSSMPKSSTSFPASLLGKLYESLAPPRAGIPLAHRCRRALRGTLEKMPRELVGWER